MLTYLRVDLTRAHPTYTPTYLCTYQPWTTQLSHRRRSETSYTPSWRQPITGHTSPAVAGLTRDVLPEEYQRAAIMDDGPPMLQPALLRDDGRGERSQPEPPAE